MVTLFLIGFILTIIVGLSSILISLFFEKDNIVLIKSRNNEFVNDNDDDTENSIVIIFDDE